MANIRYGYRLMSFTVRDGTIIAAGMISRGYPLTDLVTPPAHIITHYLDTDKQELFTQVPAERLGGYYAYDRDLVENAAQNRVITIGYAGVRRYVTLTIADGLTHVHELGWRAERIRVIGVIARARPPGLPEQIPTIHPDRVRYVTATSDHPFTLLPPEVPKMVEAVYPDGTTESMPTNWSQRLYRVSLDHARGRVTVAMDMPETPQTRAIPAVEVHLVTDRTAHTIRADMNKNAVEGILARYNPWNETIVEEYSPETAERER